MSIERTISVLLFAGARTRVGANEVELRLTSDATVSQLRTALLDRYEGLRPLGRSLLIAINEEYVDDEIIIPADATVACFPPVSGG